MLHAAIGSLESSAPLVSRIRAILDVAIVACPIAGAVVRDAQDRVLTATDDGHLAKGVPNQILALRTLLPRGETDDDCPIQSRGRGARGSRSRKPTTRLVGSMGEWALASVELRHSLGDTAQLLSYQVSREIPGSRNL